MCAGCEVESEQVVDGRGGGGGAGAAAGGKVRGRLCIRLRLRVWRWRAPVVQAAGARLHEQLHLRDVHELVAVAATAYLLVLRPTHRDHREHRTSASPHCTHHTTVRGPAARSLTRTARPLHAEATVAARTPNTTEHPNYLTYVLSKLTRSQIITFRKLGTRITVISRKGHEYLLINEHRFRTR